mmetsp:Transcript_26107/g.56614  ORF Transcript_26107/g.56614 Transcript_26107/m.56614 type:complete len:510 (-) Transcript_26107:162-1691(-)
MDGGGAPAAVPHWQGQGRMTWDDWGKQGQAARRHEYAPVGMSGHGRPDPAWAAGSSTVLGGGTGSGAPSGGGSDWKGGGDRKGGGKSGYKGRQERSTAYVGYSSVQEWLTPGRDDDRKGGGSKGKGKDRGDGKGKGYQGNRPYESRGPRDYNPTWNEQPWKGRGKGKDKDKGSDDRRRWYDTKGSGGKEYVPKGSSKGSTGKSKDKQADGSPVVRDDTQEDKSRSYTAAGVIFFTRDAEGKVTNLLLGVEDRKVKFKDMGEDKPGQSTMKVVLFPQGKVQKRDADFVATAKRELLEETGEDLLVKRMDQYLPGCSEVPAHFLENAKMMVVFIQVGEDGFDPPPFEGKEGAQMSLFWVPVEMFAGDKKLTTLDTPSGEFPLFPVTRKYISCRQFQAWLNSPTKMLAPIRSPSRSEEEEQQAQQQEQQQEEQQQQEEEVSNIQDPAAAEPPKIPKQVGDDTDGQEEMAPQVSRAVAWVQENQGVAAAAVGVSALVMGVVASMRSRGSTSSR